MIILYEIVDQRPEKGDKFEKRMIKKNQPIFLRFDKCRLT